MCRSITLYIVPGICIVEKPERLFSHANIIKGGSSTWLVTRLLRFTYRYVGSRRFRSVTADSSNI
jgi:hypothetical protein